MKQLTAAPASVLLLDYDGTLAPFHTERHRAYPYPQVIPLLESILKCCKIESRHHHGATHRRNGAFAQPAG